MIFVDINSVPKSTQNVIANKASVSSDIATKGNTADSKQITSNGEAAVYEKSDKNKSNVKTYTRDTVTLNEISKQVEMKMSSLRSIVENLFSVQTAKTSEAQGLSYDDIVKKYDGKLSELYKNLQVDDSTRLNAQKDISEDGFWGIKQTSERAIEFAKALSGGDPSKMAELRKGIEDGYKAAEKAWGGALPEICKQTQEATLKGLDDWANEANQIA